jgi:hypothetical protein
MSADRAIVGTDTSLLGRRDRVVRGAIACALGLTAMLTFVLYRISPFMPGCLFHKITGVSCLTCGMTRSLEASSHGSIRAAFEFHLMGPLVFAGIIALCIVSAAEASTGRRIVKSMEWHRHALRGFITVWIVYGVIRMIVEL